MKTILALLLICALIALWVVWGRVWLKDQPWAWSKAFFAWLDPIEVKLWKKSETIMWARLKVITGMILTIMTSMGTIDLTPLMPLVPAKYQGLIQVAFNMLPLVLTLIGLVDEKLRRDTTLPLALVAVTDKELATNAVIAEAVNAVDIAKTDAIATVVEEKS